MTDCKRCGKPFTPKPAKGRPRLICYTCKPIPRKRAKVAALEGSADVGGQTNVSRLKTASDPATVGSQHCGWCNSFVPPGMAFCNSQHRALFAERVAAAKASNIKRDSLGREIRRPGNHGRGRRPLERMRSDDAHGTGYPAEVANPIDPPTVNGPLVTRTIS